MIRRRRNVARSLGSLPAPRTSPTNHLMLPFLELVATGAKPLFIIGAMAGGCGSLGVGG